MLHDAEETASASSFVLPVLASAARSGCLSIAGVSMTKPGGSLAQPLSFGSAPAKSVD